jgi:multicomponent K+:H+ antiporter subunit E
MKRATQWLLPHPLLTVTLVIVWVLLQNDVTAGMVAFGIILGIIIPRITAVWWPEKPKAFRLTRLVPYVILVLWDIIVANIEVAWIVLTMPNAKLRPAWIVVPLELKQPEAISFLASTITLTPGTVTADLSSNGHSLLVHVLHTDDSDGVRDDIKTRYERRLLEIFS